MNRRFGKIVGLAPILVMALAILVGTSTRSDAQYMGYGGYGVGGYGMGGYGMTGYGMNGYGMNGYGTPGYGMGGYGMGGYGYPGNGYGLPGYGYGFGLYPSIGYPLVGNGGFGYASFYGPVYPPYNPLFGLGLSPLGVQSALAERALIRGSRVSRGYSGVSGPVVQPNTSYGNGRSTTYFYPR